jgi:Tfp pilus assembly protein PilZ
MYSEKEKRNERRLEQKLLVDISNNGLESMGMTTNISRNGMFIVTTQVLAINSDVSILLGAADETFALKGQVIWSREWSEPSAGDVQAAVGIKIVEASEGYLKYVERVLSQGN